jgi:CelD/BcsL family acetyltransferase involved in cellulose biosynthesis
MAPPRRKPTREAAPARGQSVSPRAPRRTGARTTLRVPDDLAETVARYAELHRTSANDALIRLAYDGAKVWAQTREIEELAQTRRAAIRRLTEVPLPVPPVPDEEHIFPLRYGLREDDDDDA